MPFCTLQVLQSFHTSVTDIIKADFDFHHYLAKCSNNPYLTTFSDNLIIKACRNENRFFKDIQNSQKSYLDHQNIIKALQNKDLPSARKLMQANWNNSLSRS